MQTEDFELMQLLANIGEAFQNAGGDRLADESTPAGFGRPDSLLSEPPVSLATLLGANATLGEALVAQLEESDEIELATCVSRVEEFLSRPDTKLFADDAGHRKLLDYAYTVV